MRYTNRARERLDAERIAALPEVLTAEEAASIVGVSDPTIKRWAGRGLVRGARIGGGQWRFSKASVLGLVGAAPGGDAR